MKTRRHVLALAGLLLSVGLGPARASGEMPFSDAAFEAARTAGRPILIAISAPWCPICRTQKPIIEKLAADPRFRNLQVFAIDFDNQKDLLRRFDARMQSTLIAYKGATEVGRSVGETQQEWIEGLLEKTL